jgi:hypothetical protein
MLQKMIQATTPRIVRWRESTIAARDSEAIATCRETAKTPKYR